MSLVGTRPILQDELLKYELHHRARIAIKPGITGMWQVSGRSDITDFEEVVRLDTEYISKSEQIKGLYVTQITEDGDLAVLSGSNQFSVSDKTFGELKFTAVRDVFLQNEDGTPSSQLKKRIYDLKCSLHGGIIPVSVPPEVPLREFPYNAVVELVNPVADTVSRKTYTGADVDWYVKAEDIVLKNKGNQNAGNPQNHTPQGQSKNK